MVEDGTEEVLVKVDELGPEDTAAEEEEKDVEETVRVADDGVDGDAVEDHTEVRVVAADELEIEDVAEEKDDKALEVAEDTGMELETDDIGGGFVSLHLYRSHQVSDVSSDDHVRPMGPLIRFNENRDEVQSNVIDGDKTWSPICLKEETKSFSYVLL